MVPSTSASIPTPFPCSPYFCYHAPRSIACAGNPVVANQARMGPCRVHPSAIAASNAPSTLWFRRRRLAVDAQPAGFRQQASRSRLATRNQEVLGPVEEIEPHVSPTYIYADPDPPIAFAENHSRQLSLGSAKTLQPYP
ncbi:hypothetical protein S40293_10477 [Stachybotrys chartarum IBT 40293]|nr:hypothetical protein S40293_10477 [Stachybotrys chartarum IBT 40293]